MEVGIGSKGITLRQCTRSNAIGVHFMLRAESCRTRLNMYSSQTCNILQNETQSSWIVPVGMVCPSFCTLFLFLTWLSASVVGSKLARSCPVIDWVRRFNLASCVLIVSSCKAISSLAFASSTNRLLYSVAKLCYRIDILPRNFPFPSTKRSMSPWYHVRNCISTICTG